jgi:hypothetical protein
LVSSKVAFGSGHSHKVRRLWQLINMRQGEAERQ